MLLVLSTPRLCSVGLWQICNGRLASLKCWICLAGAAALQQLAVARSVLQSRPAAGVLQIGVMLQPCQVTALLGNKLETCSVCAAWQVGKFKVLVCLKCSVGALVVWQGLQICNILQWPDLFCNQNLQLDPVQIGQ